MTGIFLAAGYATRLYPLTENFPKPLLEVGGDSILGRLVRDLADCVPRFVVVTNHRFAGHFEAWARQEEERLGPGRIRVLDDGTSTNETRLGAVRDILFARDRIPAGEDLLVAAGDNVLDFSLADFAAYAAGCGTSCVMCHEERRLEVLRKTAVITTDAEGRITSYEEKPREPKGHLAVPPFYYYRAADAARIEEALAGGCSADAPGSFAAWLAGRTELRAWRMPGKRYDIGDLPSYEEAKRIFGEKEDA